MIYKSIPFDSEYSVSDTGIVINNITGEALNQRVRKDRYLDVSIKRKMYLVHRLVLMAFKGMPTKEKPIARHLDGTRTNNSVDNLEWGDYIENRADRVLHGTQSTWNKDYRGQNVVRSVLKDIDVITIKHILATWELYDKEIAAMFGVRRECINKIRRGVRWAHITI